MNSLERTILNDNCIVRPFQNSKTQISGPDGSLNGPTYFPFGATKFRIGAMLKNM